MYLVWTHLGNEVPGAITYSHVHLVIPWNQVVCYPDLAEERPRSG